MTREIQAAHTLIEELERRLSDLARHKSRLELINNLLSSLSSVAGLDNMVQRILNILMQTIGAANISVIFRLDDAWQFRDIYGANREFRASDNPDAATVLASGKSLRVADPGMQVPYPGEGGAVPVENWIFPLLSLNRKVGVVCMEGMQLTDLNIFEELQPFFVYAGVLLDNEISNYSQLAEAHLRLQESEVLYRTLFEQSPDGIVLWSAPELGPIQFNTAAHTQLGYSRDEFAALTVGDFHVSDDPTQIGHYLETLHRDGAVSFEAVHRAKAGDSRDTLVSLKTFELSGCRMVQAIHHDISEQKRVEAYREMGRDILKILNEPGDLNDSIQRVIAALKTWTGFDAVGIRLQDGDDFPYSGQKGFPEDFLLTENSLFERAEDGGVCRDQDGQVNLECTCGLVLSGRCDSADALLTPGGSFWTNDSFPLLDLPPGEDSRFHPRNQCMLLGYASVALVPIHNRDRIVGLIQFNDRRKGRFTLNMVELLEGIALHIGAALMRKQAEEEKIQLEAQLHQAQKMESVGRLAGGVAHDFNNMLSVILGHAELALMKSDPTQSLHVSLEEIRKAAVRSADLTRQLLAFARKQTIAPKVLDLNETVSGMLKMLQRLIGEAIHLKWQPEANLWPVKVDPTQIDQIMANLCVNARDSIADVGEIIIETRNSVIDNEYSAQHAGFVPGEYIRLSVSDDGCGMGKETLPHIFEPFFTTKGTGKGTGLGLATVYGIVKQNNGFIFVHSEPDHGTIFTLYLPRHGCLVAQTGTVGMPEPTPRGQETILLVEDEQAILKLSTELLQLQGYTVLAANTPGEAIRLAGEHAGEIQLLMTDVIMPEMNGRDLANKLLSLNPRLKVLFMSGYTADVIAHHGVIDEGVHFIQKPFSVQNVAAEVRKALD